MLTESSRLGMKCMRTDGESHPRDGETLISASPLSGLYNQVDSPFQKKRHGGQERINLP